MVIVRCGGFLYSWMIWDPDVDHRPYKLLDYEKRVHTWMVAREARKLKTAAKIEW